MSIFSFITLLGGLAFFLYGMDVMSNGLEKMAGGKLESTLRRVTSSRFLSLLLGLGITVTIQSSSALTVMLVGLVNSGIMEFGDSIGILMGSNIGTTFTAWILSLSGINSDNVFINMLKPSSFSPIFALVGIILIMSGKNEKKKSVGNIFIGFSVLMFGMSLMSNTMEPLSEMPEFVGILTAFKNPLLAILFGAVFTGIIQSSSASVGVLQALSLTGNISYSIAIPIIMGQNIGTCITAIISSVGVNRNAKKVAIVHLAFNIIGTVICFIPFLILSQILKLHFFEEAVTPVMIAVVHSIFNIITTIILFPFTKQLEKLANKLIPDKALGKKEFQLDERLMTVPSFAVSKAFGAAVEMSDLAKKGFMQAIDLIYNYSEKGYEEVNEIENKLDSFEDNLGTYMVKLSKTDVKDDDAKKIAIILHTINDFERVGDHAQNLAKVAKEINDKKIDFSHEAKKEITVLSGAIFEILSSTSKSFETLDSELAKTVEPLEQVIDKLIAEIKSSHIKRLQKGNCTIELGFILTDLLTNCERVSDHCSNIAVDIIEILQDAFETHEYLNSIKSQESGNFRDLYDEYSKRFSLQTDK